jgi:folate-binding protein YgfZ
LRTSNKEIQVNQSWPDFMAQQGAHLQEGVVLDFGDAATERIASQSATVIVPLIQYGLLKVSGDDAQTFLQNMLSSDINAITSQQAQLSSLNSAKGRVLATLLIWRAGSEYFLQLPLQLVSTIQKKLTMYVLRSKVKVEDVSAKLICIGISGDKAESNLIKEFGSAPEAANLVAHFGETSVIRLNENRFQLSTRSELAPALWSKLSAKAQPVGTPCWDWLNIHAGIPTITAVTQEQFVLQMLNLDALGGVSFKKGCYPGQEVVARMHYLGKLKRRLYLAHLESALAPQAGDELFSADLEGQASGMIVNAAAAPNGGYDVLAVVQVASHDEHPVHHSSAQGARLQFQSLPYKLP